MTQLTKESFLHDVRDHKLTILRDDGVYRHIRLSRPNTRCMQFDLVTWPGYLAYCGDMGDFTFSRLADMFEFFRTDSGRINPQYWAEKIQATDNGGGHKEFSDEQFQQVVIRELVAWMREHRHETTKEQRRELWDAVRDDVLHAESCSTGQRKFDAANEFSHHFHSGRVGGGFNGRFEFRDFWDHNFDDWTFRYLWCCYAIVWGIQRYDEAKVELAKLEAA